MLVVLIGIAVLIRILSNSFANVFQKQLTTGGNSPFLINFLTYFLLSLLVLISLPFISIPSIGEDFWWYSVAGALVGATGNALLVKALEKGALSVLGPINAYKSIVGLVLGIFLLKEYPNLWGILGIVLIIGGSYFVLDTPEEPFSFSIVKKKEIQYRFLALLLTGVEAVFIKKVIVASTSYLAFASWCVAGALVSWLLLLIKKENLRLSKNQLLEFDWKKLGLLVACIGAMQLSTTFSLQYLPVGYALALFQLSIIVTVFLGRNYFQETGLRSKLIGSSIMIAGSLLIILFNQ